MFFHAILQSRHTAVALLAGIILAAGGAIWEQGPGKDLRNKQRSSDNVCMIRQVNIAALMYAQDHGQKYPDADRWEQQMRPYLSSNIRDYTLLTEDDNKPHRIAINKRIAGRGVSELRSSSSAVLFFESTASNHNAADDLQSLPGEGLTVAIGYADGHVYDYSLAWKQVLDEPRSRRELLGELVSPSTAKHIVKK